MKIEPKIQASLTFEKSYGLVNRVHLRHGFARWLAKPLILAMFFGVEMVPSNAQSASPPARFDFQGKLLVVACDADMLPSAYIDGKLGPEAGLDMISVIRLDAKAASPAKLKTASIGVSNSVTGPPAAVAVTPDGHLAIVAETQGPRPAARPDATMKDLAVGKRLTVVDLTNPEKPAVVQQVDTYERPVSVAVNASGNTVIVAYAAKSHSTVPLVLFHLENGRLSKGVNVTLPGYMPTDGLTDAEFLPEGVDSQEAIGVTFGSDGYGADQHARLALFTLNGDTLRSWGNVVEIDPSPYLVRFTANGRIALVNSMHNFASVRGTVTSVHLAESRDATGAPIHVIASRVEAGQYPEGLAVSPDGRWVATANLETSPLPSSDPGQRFFGSVSLNRLNPISGLLERIGDFPFDGMLPEPLVFDNSSRFLAVGNFSQFDDPRAGGAIEFFRIAENNPQLGRVELVHLKDSVRVSRGPESMAIVR